MIILFDSLSLFKYRKKIMAPFRCLKKTDEENISLTYFRSVNAAICFVLITMVISVVKAIYLLCFCRN